MESMLRTFALAGGFYLSIEGIRYTVGQVAQYLRERKRLREEFQDPIDYFNKIKTDQNFKETERKRLESKSWSNFGKNAAYRNLEQGIENFILS